MQGGGWIFPFFFVGIHDYISRLESKQKQAKIIYLEASYRQQYVHLTPGLGCSKHSSASLGL